MKINFDSTNTNQSTDKVTISQSSIKPHGMGKQDAYALDISGTVMDNSAYGGQGKTAEIMQSAQQGYLAMQQNYMTVMSNFASEEDYAELAKEGYKPGSVDVETIVTVVDEIKAKLAEAGIEIAGYNDDMSYSELQEITGSSARGLNIAAKLKENDLPVNKENIEEAERALEKAEQLTQMSDSAKKTLVLNDSTLSIDRIYRAQYSANSQNSRQSHGYYQDAMPGYYSKKADTYDWKQLAGQMEKVIKNAGLDVNEETMNQAKWLVESGIELTTQTISKLHEIEQLQFPLSQEQVLNSIVNAFTSGKSAREANLAQSELLIEQAKQVMEDTLSVTEEAVRVVVEQEQPLTIRNLVNAVGTKAEESGQESVAFLTARRQLEEVRLHMTLSANLRLLKNDYQIDTTELSQLVEDLKAQEEKAKQILFQTEESELLESRSVICETTGSIMRELPFKPAAVLGKLLWEDTPLTIQNIKEQGDALIKQYEEAGKRYETLGTAPRRDLGDSIQTAFRNVDDILTDMGYELTEANRKAVRILGYNNMTITDENMVMVKDAELAVERVTEKLKPAATLHLIRDGLNPLEMTVQELDDYLTKQETADDKSEKYSEFLYQLDKNGGITPEERESYIGIYRLMRQIEKSDGAVIGSLVRQGAELSIQNLLTGLRTRQKGNVDYQVDDTNGVVTTTKGLNNSISSQIETYYNRLAQDVFDHLNPDGMSELANPDISIEMADELLKKAYAEQKKGADYYREQAAEYRELNQVSEDTLQTLMSYDVELTGDSLLSAELLFSRKDKSFEKLMNWDKEGKNTLQDVEVPKLQDAFTDEESASKAYEDFVAQAEAVLAEREEKVDNRLDLKAVRNVRKMLTIATKLAKNENYTVPAEINGEITSINLQILHRSGENGKVQVTFESSLHGEVYAEFEGKADTFSGMIACTKKEGLNLLQESADNMREQLKQQGIATGDFYFSAGSEWKLQKSIAAVAQEYGLQREAQTDGTKVSDRTLYQVAKAFITSFS